MVVFVGAACYGADPDMFFLTKGGRGKASEAKAICATCPAVVECVAFAVDRKQLFGIWGGTSERTRRHLRKAAA